MQQRFSILLATLLCFLANAELIHVAESDLIAGRFSPISPELLNSGYFNGKGDSVRAATLEDTLVEGWTNISEEIDISAFNLTESNSGIINEILNRHQELFYVNGGFSYSYIPGPYTITSIYPKYSITDKAKIAQMNSELEVATANALSFIPDGATDLEKALVLHDYIATHCDYLDDESRPHIRNIYGVLVERKAVCAGYAITYNYLLSKVGIDSEYVASDEMKHAWSMITLNGKKYHVDVTWDDPTNNSRPGIRNHVCHENFLLNDSGIKATGHTSWEQASYYTGNDSKYNSYFWKNASPYVIPCLNGYAYAFNSDNGKLGKYILSSGALSATLLTVDDSWPVWDKQGYTWVGNFSGVQLVNGSLYYNTPTKVYSFNQSTNKSTEVSFSYSSSLGYIYGLHQEAPGQLQAALSKSPNDSSATFVDINLAKISVTGVTLSPTTAQLSVGGTLSLTATVSPSNATDKSITWKSSNTNVATVSGGEVTAVAPGTATITVTTADGSKTATCTVTVKAATVAVTGVTVSPTTAEMTVGDTLSLTATVQPSDATNKAVSWKSSNTNVATVDSTGKITAVAVGSTTITVATADGNKTATCAITVKAATIPVTGVTLNKTDADLVVGNTLSLSATVKPSNATNRDVTWKSSNNSVATVDSTGKVKAIAAGTATITVTTKDGAKTATCTITVNAQIVHVTGISLDRTSVQLKPEDSSLTLTATIKPANATNKTVLWESSNKAVALVTSTGMVIVVAPGTTIIKATAEDGGMTASCIITVPVAVTGVTLDPTNATLNVGDKPLELIPHIMPANATDQTVSWTSSNSAVATVDSTGKVTAVAPGTAIITTKTNDGGKTATCAITVPAAVTGVSLNCSTATIKAGGSPLALKATLQPSNATNKAVTWTSSNTDVAKVDSTGKVTAVAAGNTIITVTTKDGNFTATCKITVTVPVKGVALNKTNATIPIGSTLTLEATIAPDDATDKKVAWSSSDSAVASVDANGNITAHDIGTATITVTTNDGDFTASCDIAVEMPLNAFQLEQGWNLVAFQILPADMSEFATVTIMECQPQSYVHPADFQLHKAYWIHSPSKQLLQFTAAPSPANEVALAEDEGFVGLSTAIPKLDMGTTTIHAWNGHGFCRITSLSQLELGHGYWIKKSPSSRKP